MKSKYSIIILIVSCFDNHVNKNTILLFGLWKEYLVNESLSTFLPAGESFDWDPCGFGDTNPPPPILPPFENEFDEKLPYGLLEVFIVDDWFAAVVDPFCCCPYPPYPPYPF